MEAGGGAFNPGAASPAQEGRRKKTRRAGKKRKDARHRKVAQKRGMADERRELSERNDRSLGASQAYEVERILAHRGKHGTAQHMFLVW